MFDYFYGQSGERFSYFRVPQILFRDIRFKDLSTDAKTLYGILLDRMSLSVKNGWLDGQGRVYIIFPIQEVMDALGCADNKATKLFRELENAGLVERKRRGLGKPNLIYVKNFADPRCCNRDKNDSGNADSGEQDAAKQRRNKTEWNNTEMSETDPFLSEEGDDTDKRTQLEEYFSQSLEIDLLLRLCPDEEDTIYQIVDLLVDTCSTKRKMLRIAGDDKPAEVVRSRFMKLTAALEQEQEANQKRLHDLAVMQSRADAQESEVRTFIKEIRRYAAIEELDESVLNRLISKILIGEVKKVDGQKVQEVRIVYNFVGEIPEIAA
jgi:ribosomal protein S20